MHFLESLKTQYPKIRENNLQVENDLITYLVILLNLKTSNETENENLQLQMITILDFIKSKYGFLTAEEIKEAFKKYVAGDFNIKVFRILDCIVVAEVLNAFVDYRGEILRNVQKTKPVEIMEITESEKNRIVEESINSKYEIYLQTNEVEEPIYNIFKYLVECGKIKMATKETPKLQQYYKNKINDATLQIKNELQRFTSTDKIERQQVKEILNSILNNSNNEDAKSKIELRAKKLVIADFFQNQKSKSIIKIF